jgi:hypothetical protein
MVKKAEDERVRRKEKIGRRKGESTKVINHRSQNA